MGSNPREQGEADPGERFAGLLRRMGAGERRDAVYPALADQYAEPGRYYHNLDHVLQCLGAMDGVRDRLADPDAVELALWFHDVVYDPDCHDNELRSALMFDRLLGVHLPTDRADRVHAMIMATVHPSGARDSDERFVADIDLSGLGLPWPKFFGDTKALRRECRHLTDTEFQLGTRAFFRKLLARPNIYLTDYFRESYGKQARRNILELTNRLDNEQSLDGA